MFRIYATTLGPLILCLLTFVGYRWWRRRKLQKEEGDCRSMNFSVHILEGLREDEVKDLIVACVVIADPLSQELMKKAAEP